MLENEHGEKITGHVGDGDGYGDKQGTCDKCNKEIVVQYDWLANCYEESIVFYECPHCKFRSWYYS